MKNLKSKVFTVAALVLLPIILMDFMQTKPTTDYLWWENIIGGIILFFLYYGYSNWIYNLVFNTENKIYKDDN